MGKRQQDWWMYNVCLGFSVHLAARSGASRQFCNTRSGDDFLLILLVLDCPGLAKMEIPPFP